MALSTSEILLKGAKAEKEQLENPALPANNGTAGQKLSDLSQVLVSMKNDMRSLQVQHEELLQAKRKLEEQLRQLEPHDATTFPYDVMQSVSNFFEKNSKGTK